MYHDLHSSDCGYFSVFDKMQQRSIYVCTREIGRSRAFHEAKGIIHFLDLVNTNDEHSNDLSKTAKGKIYYHMCNVILQLASTNGNVCIFCGRGRSRSPAYLAAYLVIVHCYSPRQAYLVLSREFVYRRGDIRGIDRDNRFMYFLDKLINETSTS